MARAFFLILFVFLAASACEPVAFHQKRHLTDQIMKFDADALETHFYQKCRYSREGSVGGIGVGAGGGCGCY